MERKNKESRKGKGTIALSQIFLLILSTIAFSYLLANSLPLVSGQSNECIRIKKSSFPEEIIPVPSGSTAQQYCNSHPDLQICASTPCSAGGGSEGGVNPKKMAQTIGENIASKEIGEALTSQQEQTTTPQTPQEQTDGKKTEGGEGGGGSSFWSYLSPSAGAGTSGWHWAGYIVSNAAIAFGISKAISWGLQLIKVDKKYADTIGWWAGGGYLVGAISAKLGWSAIAWLNPLTGLGIGLGLGILIALFSWKDIRYYQVTFSCMPWDASTGENDCKLCNNEDIPCTEYRCMSLGTYCTYLEEEQLCVFDDRRDTKPPTIEPWEDILTEGYQYSPDNAISPPNRGVKIVNPEDDEGCIEPFTALKFGVMLDKPARCKISLTGGKSFEDMENRFMDNGLTIYNHSYLIPPVPSAGALASENLTFREGGEFSVYIRCETRQGYSTQSDFVFNLCVDDGPDMGEPSITRTSIMNNAPISYFDEGEEREIDLTIYTNEPAQCRWSRLEQAYEDMPTENQINCPASLSVLDTTNLGDYTCESTTLTGLKNREDNDYYISCIDQPKAEDESLRNAMEVPYHFRLIGTQPLILDSVEPNNTIIRDSTQVIEVTLEAKTSAGYDRGAARCSFSPSGEDRFVEFYETGTHEHRQRLDLAAGDYSYDIRCVDLAGNADTTTITFTVETDTNAPTIVRAFREGEYLKIITDEDAKCVYSNPLTIGCRYDFEDGTEMNRDTVEYGTTHSLPWDSDKTFYIKCEDEFKNRPAPDKCSITARPYEA